VTGTLDWSKIEFPSDRLTVGTIRRRHPEVFTRPDHGIAESLIRLLAFDILSNEMDLAALAFAQSGGSAPPDLLVSRQEIVQTLLADYEAVGLGAGPASRQALIEKIESDAAILARSAENRGIS
jgi:hypothetical protein